MKKLLWLVAAMTFLPGCATIIHGSRQQLGIASTPSKALVYVDGQLMGKTPTLVNLRRKLSHQVKIVLPGYAPYETNFIRKVDPWIAGNIVFGGLIGLAIDAVTGSMYKLTPNQLQAVMAASGHPIAALSPNNGIYVTVLLKPAKDWQLIGQLKKSAGR
jgi:hypothetical protein